MNTSDPKNERPEREQDRPSDDRGREPSNYGSSTVGRANEEFTPSQAEGDRDTIERDLGERQGDGSEEYDAGGGGQGEPYTTPSQAEGDRDTVEADLEEKGLGGS